MTIGCFISKRGLSPVEERGLIIVFCPLFFTEGKEVSVAGSRVVRLVFFSFDLAKDLPEVEAEDGAECQAEKKKEHLVILFAAFAVFLQKRGLESFGFAFLCVAAFFPDPFKCFPDKGSQDDGYGEDGAGSKEGRQRIGNHESADRKYTGGVGLAEKREGDAFGEVAATGSAGVPFLAKDGPVERRGEYAHDGKQYCDVFQNQADRPAAGQARGEAEKIKHWRPSLRQGDGSCRRCRSPRR